MRSGELRRDTCAVADRAYKKNMMPDQTIQVGVADVAIQLRLLRLPYPAGRDSVNPTGGIFTTKAGEFGVVVDASLSAEDAQRIVAEELQKNIGLVTALAGDAKRPQRGSPPISS